MSRYFLPVALLASLVFYGCGGDKLSKSLQQAEQQYADGEYAAALDSCEQAMTSGDSEEIYLAMVLQGRIYLAMGDTDQALATLNNAVELQPNKPDAYRRRADVWERLGDTQKAAADNALARSRAPDAISSQLNMDRTGEELNRDLAAQESTPPGNNGSARDDDATGESQEPQVVEPWDALTQEDSPAESETTGEGAEPGEAYQGMPQTPLEGTLSHERPAETFEVPGSQGLGSGGAATFGTTPQQIPQQQTPPADMLSGPRGYQWNDYLHDVLPGGGTGAAAPRTPPTTGIAPAAPPTGATADGSLSGQLPSPLSGSGRLSTGIVSDPREVPSQALPAAGSGFGGVAGGAGLGGTRVAPASSALPGTALPAASSALPGTAPLSGYGTAPAGSAPGSAAIDGGAAGASGSALGPAGSASPYPLPGAPTPAPGALPSGTAPPSTGLPSGQ